MLSRSFVVSICSPLANSIFVVSIYSPLANSIFARLASNRYIFRFAQNSICCLRQRVSLCDCRALPHLVLPQGKTYRLPEGEISSRHRRHIERRVSDAYRLPEGVISIFFCRYVRRWRTRYLLALRAIDIFFASLKIRYVAFGNECRYATAALYPISFCRKAKHIDSPKGRYRAATGGISSGASATHIDSPKG